MNLNDFRTRAARVSGMSTSDSGDLALLDSYANEAVLQFLKSTKINVRTASMAVTADQGDYTLDTDILSMEDLYVDPASGNEEQLLRKTSSSDITEMRLREASADVSVMYYALEGAHTLLLYPSPQSSSDTLHMRYVPRPTSSLAATADSPSATAYGNIPEEFHPALLSYILWKACEAEDHRPSEFGLKHQAEWERQIAKTRSDLNRKTGVMSAPAKWGRRPQRNFATPGTDLG